jgi:hypothetical protein
LLGRSPKPDALSVKSNLRPAALGALSLGALGCGLLPLGAAAQTTEPLLPVPSAPIGPQVPVSSGQPILPGQTVLERPRPDLDPIGLHTGDFFWFPRAEADEAYNSNIFALPSPTHDWITTLQPSLDVLSGYARDAVNLHSGAAFQRYAIHPSQNTATGFASVEGRLEIGDASSLYGNAEAAHLYLPRTSPNSPGGAAQPVTYNNYSATIQYAETGYRLGYEADLGVQATDYNAVPAIGAGILPQSSGDVTLPQAALRVSYEFVPDYEAYVRTSATLFAYPHTTPGGVRFNSTVYRSDLGLRIGPRHVLYGEVYIGYLSEIFALSSLGSVTSPDAGGRLIWNVTRLTTISFNALRTFQTTNPSIGVIGTGYLDSSAVVYIDHELRHNFLVSANAGYENDQFQGISRTDSILSAGVSLKYLLNRNLYVGPSYNFQKRASSGSLAGLPYSQSIVTLRVSTQF